MSADAELEAWGWNQGVAAAFAQAGRPTDQPGRVVAEHAGLFRVRISKQTVLTRPTGKLRQRIEEAADARPVVGDWVTVGTINQGGESSLTSVLPRRSFIARKDPNGFVVQPIVANVDKVLIVSALTGDVNPRRLERYLAMVYESGARAVIVLTKVDVATDVHGMLEQVKAIAGNAAVHAVSPKTGLGMDALDSELVAGETLALVGSSGVGKSTLINRWAGNEQLAIGGVDDLGRGRHTTTSRQLVRLLSGVMVIDTPGMRELALWDSGEGVQAVFNDIEALAARCRFRDCRHETEPGCAVRAAVNQGTLEAARVDGFHKLSAEVDRLAARDDALRRAQKKSADKPSARTVDAHVKTKRKPK